MMTTSPQAHLFLSSAGLTLGLQLVGFVAAFLLQTETFYDVFGGLNYLLLALWTAYSSDTSLSTCQILSTVLFVASRSWLLLFLAWRAHERKGDSRFDEVKDKFGLFLVYWMVQAFWVFLISLPLIFIHSSSTVMEDDQLSLWDMLFAAGFALGVVVEITADVQKAIWVRQKRPGGFCSVGVWNFSRHPNYFGEMLQWWSLWLWSYGSTSGSNENLLLWCFCSLSPLFTMHILLNTPGTGIAHAEGSNLARYYNNPQCAETYKEYRANTSILIPMVGYRQVPMTLKRTLFLDLERYEYRPPQSSGNKQD